MFSRHIHPRYFAAVAFPALMLLACGAFAQDKQAQAPDQQAREAPAPRSVSDIITVLEQYKPDAAAIEKAQATLKLELPQTDERKTLFNFYFERGLAARTLGDDNEGIVSLRKAREFMTPGAHETLFALEQLAGAEYNGGNLLNTVEVLRERLRQIPPNMAGYVLGHEGFAARTYTALGDFDAARASLRNAEATFARLSKWPNMQFYRHLWTAQVERARGEIFLVQGRFVEAEAALRKALREFEADGPDREIRTRRGMTQATDDGGKSFHGLLQARLSWALMHLGRLGEAELHIRGALKNSLERIGRYSTAAALNLQQFAQILVEQGRFAESALMAQEALKSVEGSGAQPQSLSAINSRKALGAALVANSHWDEALANFDALRSSLARDPELARRLGSADLDWAHALLKRNRGADAKAMLEPMLAESVRQRGERDTRTAQIRGFYAIALEKSGARPQALVEFGKAVPILIEQARNDIAADTGRVRQVRRLTLILENYLELLAKMQRAGLATPGLDPIAESFRLADIARGSEVQRALSASAARTTISDPALADLARREQDAQRRINALSDILKSLLAAPPDQQLPNVMAQMRKDVDGLTKERGELKSQIEKRFPDYAELIDPKPVSTAQVQAALRAGETLISIYLGEDSAFVWAVPKSGSVVLAGAPLSMAQAGKTVEQLRKALDPSATNINEIPAFDVATAARLYEQLLKPVEAAWKGSSRHLLVVPHGPLGQLPFGLLPTLLPAPAAPIARSPVPFEEYKTVPWLIRQVTLTQLPSVTALTTLRKTPQPRGERRMYFGIGDPLFSKEQAAASVQLAAATPTASTSRGVPIRLRSAPKTAGVSSAELSLLPRLPDTADELMEIAKTLGADMAKDVVLRKDANETTLKTMNLADRRIIHFATHGLVPGELNGLTQPALALTAPEVAGVEGDGLLTMDEILALKLNADWVVLSACNTASGDGAGQEAVSGLGRAFFYAGARALLVSNWPVDSVAARRLMTDLFRRYAAGAPTAKADSLRQAMVAMLDGPGFIDPATGKPVYAYAHPLFWAPFVLVGD
jgi:CHAT domain-containing protein